MVEGSVVTSSFCATNSSTFSLGYGKLLPARATGTQNRAITALYSFITLLLYFGFKFVRFMPRDGNLTLRSTPTHLDISTDRVRHSTHFAYQSLRALRFIPTSPQYPYPLRSLWRDVNE